MPSASRLLKIRGRSATPRGSRECRALGAPAASCAKKSTRVRNHGHAGITRHSPRNGFNGFLRALPGDRAFLSPSSPRSLLLKNLTPASGRQNHTTSPSAKPSAFVSALLASTASRPAFVTIASRPSVGRDGEGYAGDLGQRRSGKFFEMGLDRWNHVEPVQQIRFCAQA